MRWVKLNCLSNDVLARKLIKWANPLMWAHGSYTMCVTNLVLT